MVSDLQRTTSTSVDNLPLVLVVHREENPCSIDFCLGLIVVS